MLVSDCSESRLHEREYSFNLIGYFSAFRPKNVTPV